MKPRPKFGPGDYAFLIGMPVVFLLIAWVGIRSLVGPPPQDHPVVRLREGLSIAGMTEAGIREKLGPPSEAFLREDGTAVLRYTRSVWDTGRRTFTEEDADVILTADGIATRVVFDSSTPPLPGSTPTPK